VLLLFGSLGTAGNSAIQKYMNLKKVPQLFIASGATKWGDPQNFPWSMGWQPNYQSEARIYAKYILDNFPDGKIAPMRLGRKVRQHLQRWERLRLSVMVNPLRSQISPPSPCFRSRT
jgi:hypothetical protein